MTEQRDMRGMLLDFALEQARRLVDTIDQSDLDFGRINETFDVAGTEWHVQVKYWADDDDVLRIEGHPHKDPSEAEEGLPEWVKHIFGGEDDDGSFLFAMPRAWLPDRRL